MCGLDKKQACSCPKGTVRASFGFIIIPSIIILAGVAMIILFIREQYESALGVLSGLTGILGTVVGYYFGSRSSESANKVITDMAHENMETKMKELEYKNNKIQKLKHSNILHDNQSNNDDHVLDLEDLDLLDEKDSLEIINS